MSVTTKKILSFGASITCGGGAGGPNHSWAAQIAQKMHREYHCHAVPGSSNTSICREIMSVQFFPNDLILVMWTSPTRFEFWFDQNWHAIGPGDQQTGFVKHWYRGPGQWIQTEIVTSLKEIVLAQRYLESLEQPYLFTVDSNEIHLNWCIEHSMGYVQNLKNAINWSKFLFFHDQGFVPWAKHCNFKVSRDGHPEREAHQRACDYILSAGLVITQS